MLPYIWLLFDIPKTRENQHPSGGQIIQSTNTFNTYCIPSSIFCIYIARDNRSIKTFISFISFVYPTHKKERKLIWMMKLWPWKLSKKNNFQKKSASLVIFSLIYIACFISTFNLLSSLTINSSTSRSIN